MSGPSSAKVIDPCTLVGPAANVTPAATPAPWGLPHDALSQIAYAGLVPPFASWIRHDHDHLDIIVNGRPITIPAGVGMAEPANFGACGGVLGDPDCDTGSFWDGIVADSPLHTHSTSGIVHIESDRPATFTLGQFFDEWGVRFSQSCLGSYCTGNGSELRVYVNGNEVSGDPRNLVLLNQQEIAVVYGGQDAFSNVPSTWTGGWPGHGCGGTGESSCQ